MDASDSFHVPEQAIAAFERLTGLTITVHDLVGRLWPYLSPERFMHNSPLCATVKSGPYGHACIDFGVTRLRRDILAQRDGRVQVCHAGLVEWIVPMFQARTDSLEWVLFAGQRTPGKLVQVTWDTREPTPRQWARSAVLPGRVEEAEAQAILESLRQLAARLWGWINEMDHCGLSRSTRRSEPPLDLAARRMFILRFIRNSHRDAVRLADLAAELGLSEDRAGHLVREACGATFVSLLNEARIRTAAALLRHSDLPVADVALRSGWGDVSRFHRVFRARTGTTPLRYRKLTDQDQRLMKDGEPRTLPAS